jgi:hypothetical protein
MTVLPSVALLLPAGSFTPTGAVIVAVFEIVPEPLAVAVTVKVAVPPESRSPRARLPLPLAGQADPALATQVQVALVSDAPGSCRSPSPGHRRRPRVRRDDRVGHRAVLVDPGHAVGLGDRQVRRRRDDRVASVALLFPAGSFTPTGAVIVAVLEIVPDPARRRGDREGRRAAARAGHALAMFPLPLAGQLDPALAVQVQVAPVTAPGSCRSPSRRSPPTGPRSTRRWCR